MPESFTTLLQKSWTYFAGHIKPILIAAVVFGIILHFAQASLAHKTMGSMEDRLGSLDTVKMEELSERIENGDEQAFQEMMMELGVLGESGEIYEEKMQGMAVEFMTKLLPSIGVFTIVMMVLSLISFTYFSILAVDDTQSALHIFRNTRTHLADHWYFTVVILAFILMDSIYRIYSRYYHWATFDIRRSYFDQRTKRGF